MNNIILLPFYSPSSVFQEHNFLYVGFPMDIVKLPLHDNIFIFLGHIFIFSFFLFSYLLLFLSRVILFLVNLFFLNSILLKIKHEY